MEPRRIGSTLLLDDPFEWSNDSSLEVFANAIDAYEEEDTARSSRTSVKRDRITAAKTLHRDIACLYEAHEARHHIPGMIGSLDCTHFDWRNCPIELRGQYKMGDHQYPTIMMEAVTSQDLWI